MTEQAQRIAIAEACGWNCDPKAAHEWTSRGQWVTKDGYHGSKLCSLNMHLPDYLNDLNAMHEAEKTIDPDEYANYEQQLRNTYPVCMGGGFHLLNATASQRAEAFLKTIGKWEDES